MVYHLCVQEVLIKKTIGIVLMVCVFSTLVMATTVSIGLRPDVARKLKDFEHKFLSRLNPAEKREALSMVMELMTLPLIRVLWFQAEGPRNREWWWLPTRW